MAWWNPCSWANAAYNSDWDKGWDAADEFMELVGDEELTAEQINAQCDAVESRHNDDYVQGYYDYFQPHPIARAVNWFFTGGQ